MSLVHFHEIDYIRWNSKFNFALGSDMINVISDADLTKSLGQSNEKISTFYKNVL